MNSEITGIILAGGKSSRMGSNKSLLTLNDKTVIEVVVDLMKSIFSKVIIITNASEEYSFLNLPMYRDIYLDMGPLAGIHSALANSATEKNFIISCDMPLMSTEMIKYIISNLSEKSITVCVANGFIEQLAGVYSKSVLPKVEELLKGKLKKLNQTKQKYSVLSLLQPEITEYLQVEKLSIYNKYLFFNMNNVEDYKSIIQIFNKEDKTNI
ncbi:MAG: molybdenum cofactor guanylyltransferase [Ignavibacteriae bacterium]|nr:molybdenum cofactor guanylyltransferase [Ignavibacteriota bacterium]